MSAAAPAALPIAFFARAPARVARALLGCVVVHRRRAAMIVEAEAYGDADDAASHARFGPRGRSAIMFGRPGVAYVYLCYGVHEMFNVVTGRPGQAGAVLIRAVAPVPAPAGDDADDPRRGRGPGKVTQVLGIDRRQLGAVVAGPDAGSLRLVRHRRPPAAAIAVGPRVGVGYAGAWAAAPLRFWWRDHPAVSAPRGPGAEAR